MFKKYWNNWKDENLKKNLKKKFKKIENLIQYQAMLERRNSSKCLSSSCCGGELLVLNPYDGLLVAPGLLMLNSFQRNRLMKLSTLLTNVFWYWIWLGRGMSFRLWFRWNFFMVAVELVRYERSQLCSIGEVLQYADPPIESSRHGCSPRRL